MNVMQRRKNMKRVFFTSIALPVVVMAGSPADASAQLKVESVCTPIFGCTQPANRPPIRRGKTETIQIKGPFVDHTVRSGVTTGNPGVTVSSVTKTTCVNEPCLAIALTTSPSFSLGARLVPIFVSNVFGSTAFNVTVVRKGEITLMTQSPSEPVWGEIVSVRVEGNDIGNTRAAVTSSIVRNQVEASSGSGFGFTTFIVVGNELSNPPTSTDVTVGDDDLTGRAGNYTFSIPKRTINYRPQTSSDACIATPGITAPSPSFPANDAIIIPTVNSVNHTLTIRWSASQGQFKATEQFILEITPLNPTTYTTPQGIMSRSLTVPRNTTYRWRVKAFNCGLAAPFSGFSTFTVR